jgi:hypothetical protein
MEFISNRPDLDWRIVPSKLLLREKFPALLHLH